MEPTFRAEAAPVADADSAAAELVWDEESEESESLSLSESEVDEPPLEESLVDEVMEPLLVEVIEGMLLLEESAMEAFLSPHSTERQAVMPSRSSGWASTQAEIHWWQTNEGMVWS